MKTWFIKNLRTLVLMGLLIIAILLAILKWHTVLAFFVTVVAIFGVFLLAFSLIKLASDSPDPTLVDIRILDKCPEEADQKTLGLQYQRETGYTRPDYLNDLTPAASKYIEWVEYLATQMLILREHTSNEKR